MTSPQIPLGERATAGRLLRSTLGAALVACVALVTVVLPLEYGIDPTRIGRVFGLQQVGARKVELARAAAQHAADELRLEERSIEAPAAPATAPDTATGRSDVTEVVLAPGSGLEIKLVMTKEAKVTYGWSTNAGAVNYDTHGDAPTVKYHSYSKGTATAADSGVLTAAFDGHHGWFWRNRGTDTVIVTLKTQGDYQELLRLP